MAQRGFHIEIRGTVQGVGYRPWVYQLARRIGIHGQVWNDTAGVRIDAFGADDALQHFVAGLQTEGPPAARVRSVTWSEIAGTEADAFTIAKSAPSSEHRVSIPADLATCDDCVRELFDPNDRRYRYPFINCTNCGPRYAIVTGSPYDRAKTSMLPFEMCAACRDEFDSPMNRRFHAQPNACPACGPQLTAMTPKRRLVETDDVIRFAARALCAGLIVAVKGIGGFHLACDATSPQAVQRLRERKRRDTKPLAIMVRDLAEAETLAVLNGEERALLTSIERPIVLANGRHEPLAGLFLPYTPLHHLLIREAGMPLVMTSGNFSEEPMVTTNDDALTQLADVADLFVLHDRDIVTRVDDSVTRVIAGAPVILRRGRGYVPRAIDARHSFAEPILGCGAQLKNTFCIASGTSAFAGPHIGDLDTVATLREYETAIERMKEFVGASPKILAHDLHPEYTSTRYARAQQGVETIAVQHHHAHIASVMAEHALTDTVLGIAWDGTGFGTDETSWGGEFLLARYGGYERFATFRPIPLAGGDQAVRQPWRTALALLDETFGGNPPLQSMRLLANVDRHAIDVVRRMLAQNVNTTRARGAGRLFDAFAAIFLDLTNARYEGELAYRWMLIADQSERGRYPLLIHDGAPPWEIDARPMLRAALQDLRSGRSVATISARFHNTLALAAAEVARAALALHGDMPVALSGGCFQNARLTESIIDAMNGARVFMNRDVPPGDGGIALGQVFVADALIREGRSCA